MKSSQLLITLCMLSSLAAMAQHNHGAATPYAGMQDRPIKSLSDNDISELKQIGRASCRERVLL